MLPKGLRTAYDTSSIGALSDGIFGVALTLLVLDIHLAGPASTPLASQLLALWPKLVSFGLTFAVVSAYWISYHRLAAHMIAFDMPLLWRNLVFLALIVLTPFLTSLVGVRHYAGPADARAAWIAYAGTLTLVGVTLAWLWHGARTRGLVDPGLSRAGAEYLLWRTLAGPMVFALSICTAFLSAPLAPVTLLLIPPAFTFVRRRYARPAEDPAAS